MTDLSHYYDLFLAGMTALAVVVFIALFFVRAGYGMLRDAKWGPKIDNRLGWIAMEAPVFIAMCILCLCSPRRGDAVCLVFFGLFQLHYLNRAFVYPLLLKGRSTMPLGIVLMGVTFNVLNALMQGGWIFYIAPEGYYTPQWLLSPQFIVGTLIFFAGMAVNIHSDRIIRRLRKPGDRNHYLPQGGMFLWAKLPNGMSAVDLYRVALARGVAICPGDPFYEKERNVSTFRINYSNSSDEVIEKGIRILGEACAELIAKKGN